MTYITNCLNCGCDEFEYQSNASYQTVRLHPSGGIILTEKPRTDYDHPEQVRCLGCGLSVERERLDPKYDRDEPLSDFNIAMHD